MRAPRPRVGEVPAGDLGYAWRTPRIPLGPWKWFTLGASELPGPASEAEEPRRGRSPARCSPLGCGENEGNPGGVSAAPGALRNAQVLGGIWGYGGGAWSPTRLRSVPLDRHLCPLNSTAARAPRSPGSFPRGLLLSGAGARGAAQSPGREAKGIPLP